MKEKVKSTDQDGNNKIGNIPGRGKNMGENCTEEEHWEDRDRWQGLVRPT
jgi:hypothetical protein